MPTKEEAYSQATTEVFNRKPKGTWQQVTWEAMDIYAKQECIALMEFIENHNYKTANNDGHWEATKNGVIVDYCSSEELYELFLQHNQSLK